MNLHFENLCHIYASPGGEKRQVLDISQWHIAAGQQVLVRGVSGSGKTTLFNITAGLLKPTQGRVMYDEQALFDLLPSARDRFRARTIGYIYHNHHLLNSLTALENVVMPLAFARQLPRNQWRKRALDLLVRVGLSDHANYRPAQMSTGQRLRVAVARALACNPPVLLADEPTAALDTTAAQSVMDLVQQIARDNNAILLVASHDPALAVRFQTIAHLQDGQLTLEERQPV